MSRLPSLPHATEYHPLRWLLPHALVWGVTGSVVKTLLLSAQCTAFCALYLGSLVYLLLAVAAGISVLIAALQLALVARASGAGSMH